MQFLNDSYDTPANKRRCFFDILGLNSRLYFYLKFLFIILKARKTAEQGKFSDKDYCDISDSTFKLLENCGAKIHITGIDNIKKTDKPVVFIGNHMSMLETFILPGIIIPYMPVSFVVKESLINHSLFGDIMKATRPIPVTRTDPKKDFKSVMFGGKQLLSKGRSIIVFPQSTRGAFKPEEFGSIGDKLAEKNQVTVIPVALKTDFWSNGKIFKDFGRIYRDRKIFFAFGEPISPTTEKKERHSRIIDFITAKYKEFTV